MAFYGFARNFGQTVGVAIGATILQNELTKSLPAGYLAEIGGTAEGAVAAIPGIVAL